MKRPPGDCDVPVGTVRSRLSRGRAILKERLDRAGLGPRGRPCRSGTSARPDPGTGGRRHSARRFDRPLGGAIRRRRASASHRSNTRSSISSLGVTQNMTISKLAAAASLLVFTGLAAWGAAGLAAQTPGKSPTRSDSSRPLASLSTTRAILRPKRPPSPRMTRRRTGAVDSRRPAPGRAQRRAQSRRHRRRSRPQGNSRHLQQEDDRQELVLAHRQQVRSAQGLTDQSTSSATAERASCP